MSVKLVMVEHLLENGSEYNLEENENKFISTAWQCALCCKVTTNTEFLFLFKSVLLLIFFVKGGYFCLYCITTL